MSETMNITRILPGDNAPTVIFSDAPVEREGDDVVMTMENPPVQLGDLLESSQGVLEVTTVDEHAEGVVVAVESTE